MVDIIERLQTASAGLGDEHEVFICVRVWQCREWAAEINQQRAALAAERERCAKIADDVARQVLLPEDERLNCLWQTDVAEYIAATIRQTSSGE